MHLRAVLHLLLASSLVCGQDAFPKATPVVNDTSDDVAYLSTLLEYNQWFYPSTAGPDPSGILWPPYPGPSQASFGLGSLVNLTYGIEFNYTWNWYLCAYNELKVTNFCDDYSLLQSK